MPSKGKKDGKSKIADVFLRVRKLVNKGFIVYNPVAGVYDKLIKFSRFRNFALVRLI